MNTSDTIETLDYPILRSRLAELLQPWLATYAVPDVTGDVEPTLDPNQSYTRVPALWTGDVPTGTRVVEHGIECVIDAVSQVGNMSMLANSNLFTNRFLITLDLWLPTMLDSESDEEPLLYTLDRPTKLIMYSFDRVSLSATRSGTREIPARALLYVIDAEFWQG